MSEEQLTGEQVEEAAAPAEETYSETESVEQQEKNIPLDALQAERAERQKLQDELRMLRDNMHLMQTQQQNTKPQEKDEFSDLSDDDVLTVGEFKKALKKKEQDYQMSIQELKVSQKYPDYQQVVSEYLPEVLKQNPSLADSLRKTQDYELAYYLAKNSDAYKQKSEKPKKSQDAERIVQNANRPGSLSGVGKKSPISEAKRYRDMSADEFAKVAKKNLGYI